MSDDKRVQGFCPMGCGKTLFLGDGGYVTCSWIECPEPDAVSTILDEDESEHLVHLEARTFTIRHPLRERLRDDLLTCEVHTTLASGDGPPRAVGDYRMRRLQDGRWTWSGVDPLPASA